jgi:hypothetical protein
MSLHLQMIVNIVSTNHQQSINIFQCCILYNPQAIVQHVSIIKVFPAFMGNMGRVNVATPKMSVNGASVILGAASCKNEEL